jgi:hypothetical protein
MRNNAQRHALIPIAIGLIGMASYQIIVRLSHPAIMEKDLFHGLWFGICLGLEIVGVYQLSKNKRGSAG